MLSLLFDRNSAVYFDSFGTEYVSQNVFKKSKINISLTTYLEYNVIILLCTDFIVLLL